MGADSPYLILETAGGERFPLQNPTTLGRVQGNDLVLADAGCSSRHATIRQDQGAWVIEDLGSTNGTYVNGERVESVQLLMEGDLIQMGAQMARVHGLPVELRCARCGAVPFANASFCPTCGLPLQAINPSVTVRMPPPRKPAAGPVPAQASPVPVPLQPVVAAPATAPSAPAASKKNGRGGLIVAAGLGILLLLIGPVVFFWPRISGFLVSRGATPLKTSLAGTATQKQNRPLPPKLALLREAILFRKAASSSNLPETIKHYEGERALDFLISSKSYKEAPAVWSYFFSGAVVLGGYLESPNPVVAYYNPFLDGVLLTQWEQKDGVARIVAADLRIASQMAGQKPANPNLAWWLSEMVKRPIPQVMKEQYATFLKAFGRDFPVEAKSSLKLEASPDVANVRTILERQALPSLVNLTNFQNPKSRVFHPGLASLKKALQSGDAVMLAQLMPANNPMKAEKLAAQPSWIRQEAVPLYALVGATRTIVLLAPSNAPRYYLYAAWAAKPSPHMEALMPYDMDGSAPPTLESAAGSGAKS